MLDAEPAEVVSRSAATAALERRTTAGAFGRAPHCIAARRCWDTGSSGERWPRMPELDSLWKSSAWCVPREATASSCATFFEGRWFFFHNTKQVPLPVAPKGRPEDEVC